LKDNDQTPISILALESGDDHIFNEVVKYADLDAANLDGQTALMIAATGQTEFVARHFQTLLEHGANIYLRDHFGQSALMYAVKANNIHAAELLIDAGADITIRDNNGYSALSLSKQNIPGLYEAAIFPQIESL
jgi:ankyrin repeat protein